jgi:hypothetical protein
MQIRSVLLPVSAGPRASLVRQGCCSQQCGAAEPFADLVSGGVQVRLPLPLLLVE